MHLINKQTQTEINAQAKIVDEAMKNVNKYVITELKEDRENGDNKIIKD